MVVLRVKKTHSPVHYQIICISASHVWKVAGSRKGQLKGTLTFSVGQIETRRTRVKKTPQDVAHYQLIVISASHVWKGAGPAGSREGQLKGALTFSVGRD